MPQDVPADLAQPGLLAGQIGPLALVLLEGAAARRAEHQFASQVPLRLEGRQGVAAERELAVASALRRPHVPAPVAAPNDEAAGNQVDVVPAQRPTCKSDSQSTATESALRSIVRWLLSDFGLSPEASFRAS